MAGEWYKWFVGQHEENPGEAKRWAKLSEVLWLLLEDVAGDPETGEIDLEAAAVREEIHPTLAERNQDRSVLGQQG